STASPTHTPAPTPSFFFFMPRPPPTSTLFPYTTLFRSAPQDGAGQDDRPRRDLHRLVDRDGAAVDLHAVCDVPQQHRLAGGLGPVQRLAGGGQGLGGVVPAFHSHIDTSKCRPGDAPAKAPAAPGRKGIGYKAGWVPNLSHYILT